jgi:hypothetical protein
MSYKVRRLITLLTLIGILILIAIISCSADAGRIVVALI